MAADRLCFHCGAPSDPALDNCGYCGVKRIAMGPSAGMAPSGWEVRLPRGELEWGPPFTIALPASDNELVVLRSHALLDDVAVDIGFRFDAGQIWAPGLTSSALGVSLRASSNAGYDVSVSIAGLVSISRYEGGKLGGWLLEPCVHDKVHEGLGAINALSITMEGDRLSVRINGVDAASVRDRARRSGAVELHVRPGAVPARVVIGSLAVRELTADV
ncbi:MAG: hypothetical protein WKG00_24440 [Polyangiaceae bacterium]